MSDLFSQQPNNPREIFKVSLGDWVNHLEYNTLDKLKTTLGLVNKDRDKFLVYPDRVDVLRLFKDCKLEDIKVVVLGQDCYYNGNANGYAFGCKEKVSPSLTQILKAMENTITPSNIDKNIDLTYLVKQGVFLLNTILTVRSGTPLSHDHLGWQNFTKDVIELIDKKHKNIVWLLWGSKAKAYSNIIKNGLILTDSHPASASYNNQVWNTNCFVECNKYLKENGKEEIKWL